MPRDYCNLMQIRLPLHKLNYNQPIVTSCWKITRINIPNKSEGGTDNSFSTKSCQTFQGNLWTSRHMLETKWIRMLEELGTWIRSTYVASYINDLCFDGKWAFLWKVETQKWRTNKFQVYISLFSWVYFWNKILLQTIRKISQVLTVRTCMSYQTSA